MEKIILKLIKFFKIEKQILGELASIYNITLVKPNDPIKKKELKLRLEKEKVKAHYYIDWIWKHTNVDRNKVYKNLSVRMGVKPQEVHLSNINTISGIKRVTEYAKEYKEEIIKKLGIRSMQESIRRK